MVQDAELPKITVVTPCLNAVATIAETLESVRAQSYPAIEHVVVDGGSTDGTVELLQAAGDSIRFISEPDQGLSDAMNKGIAMAQGEVIGWLNADDYYLPSALDQVGAAFKAPEIVWVTGLCRNVDAGGTETRPVIARYKRFLLKHYSFRLLLTQNFVAAPATFVRRETYLRFPFDLRYTHAMDYDVWLQIAREHDPKIIDRELTCFRLMEGTLTMSGFETGLKEVAQQARERGHGHRLAVTANQFLSRVFAGLLRLRRFLRHAG